MPDETDNEARHAAEGGETGETHSRSLRDLARAVMRPSASQIVLAAILLVFGIGVGTQFAHAHEFNTEGQHAAAGDPNAGSA